MNASLSMNRFNFLAVLMSLVTVSSTKGQATESQSAAPDRLNSTIVDFGSLKIDNEAFEKFFKGKAQQSILPDAIKEDLDRLRQLREQYSHNPSPEGRARYEDSLSECLAHFNAFAQNYCADENEAHAQIGGFRTGLQKSRHRAIELATQLQPELASESADMMQIENSVRQIAQSNGLNKPFPPDLNSEVLQLGVDWKTESLKRLVAQKKLDLAKRWVVQCDQNLDRLAKFEKNLDLAYQRANAAQTIIADIASYHTLVVQGQKDEQKLYVLGQMSQSWSSDNFPVLNDFASNLAEPTTAPTGGDYPSEDGRDVLRQILSESKASQASSGDTR